jgi:hypothetical protein
MGKGHASKRRIFGRKNYLAVGDGKPFGCERLRKERRGGRGVNGRKEVSSRGRRGKGGKQLIKCQG